MFFRYIEQYLDCVETVIESFCNVDAAKWQRTMDEKSLEPLVSRIGCSFGGSKLVPQHSSAGIYVTSLKHAS